MQLPSATSVDGARAAAVEKGGSFRVLAVLGRRPKIVIGGAVLALMVVAAILAPQISPHDPNQQILDDKLLPPAWLGGKPQYVLGTDNLGRDLLSRIITGGRISLLVGFTAVFTSGSLGTILGLMSGYYGGLLDGLIMRAADIQLAFPYFLLVILILVVLGQSVASIIIVLAFADWVTYARTTRGRVLVEKEKAYVEAARAVGARDAFILFRHILPNVIPIVLVIATPQVGFMILLESSLSYLGIGVQPPTSSWGRMINDGQPYMAVAWWLSTMPGLAIVLTVLSANFLGDGLREALGIE